MKIKQITYFSSTRKVTKNSLYQDVAYTIRKTNGNIWLHRKTAPAYITYDTEFSWFNNGKNHRKDGPAKLFDNGKILGWYLYGVKTKEESYWNY